MKHAALGMGLAGTTLGMAAIGYAVDRYFQVETLYATAMATLVGFAFAMFRFIQHVTQNNP